MSDDLIGYTWVDSLGFTRTVTAGCKTPQYVNIEVRTEAGEFVADTMMVAVYIAQHKEASSGDPAP